MNNDIREKQKGIDRSHWMCRIQKFTFGIDAPAFYMGYCPFFWMTWLAVVCSPFGLIGRGFYKLAIEPFVNIKKHFDHKAHERAAREIEEEERLKSVPLEMDFDQILGLRDIFEQGGFSAKKRIKHAIDSGDLTWKLYYWEVSNARIADRNKLWLEKNYKKWDQLVAKAELERKKAEKEHAKEMAEIERISKIKEARRKRIRKISGMVTSKITFVGKLIAKIIIPLLAITAPLAAIYGLVLIPAAAWATIGLVASIIAAGFAGAGIVIFLIKISPSIVREFTERCGEDIDTFWNNKIAPKLMWTAKPLMWLGSKVGAIVIFLIETVKMTYNRECPLIVWGEETTPIKKRESKETNQGA